MSERWPRNLIAPATPATSACALKRRSSPAPSTQSSIDAPSARATASASIARDSPLRSQSPPTKRAIIVASSVLSSARTTWRTEALGQNRSRSTPLGVSSIATPGYASRELLGDLMRYGRQQPESGQVDTSTARPRSQGLAEAMYSSGGLRATRDGARRPLAAKKPAWQKWTDDDVHAVRHQGAAGVDDLCVGPSELESPPVRKRQGNRSGAGLEGSGTRRHSTRSRRSSATLHATIVKR